MVSDKNPHSKMDSQQIQEDDLPTTKGILSTWTHQTRCVEALEATIDELNAIANTEIIEVTNSTHPNTLSAMTKATNLKQESSSPLLMIHSNSKQLLYLTVAVQDPQLIVALSNSTIYQHNNFPDPFPFTTLMAPSIVMAPSPRLANFA
jgi:hypothetical protein